MMKKIPMYKPNFQITLKILNDIAAISEIKAIVERSRVLPLNEAQLRRQAIIRMAHTSTSIEGNRLAEFQVDKVLAGMSVSADAKSILEVKNYQQALKEMEKMVSDIRVLNFEHILSLHRVLMKGLVEEKKLGSFRPGPIYVVDDLGDGREKLRFQGPPASRLIFLINELLTWLVQAQQHNLHPILQAAVSHVQFVAVHPFTDGNGRMARLLTNFVLYRTGWDFRKIIVLEDYYNRDRQGYYNAINAVSGDYYHEGEDLTSWIEYFTGGFVTEAKKVAEAIAMSGFGKISDGSNQILLDHDELRMMDFITTTGRLTSADTQEILGVAKRTAQFKLKRLTEKGLIKLEGKGPASYYALVST